MACCLLLLLPKPGVWEEGIPAPPLSCVRGRAVFYLDGMINSASRSAGDRTAPEGGLHPRLKASGRRAGSDNPPPGGRTSCAQDHRFSGAALNAPSQPETGDSAVCMK